MALKQDRPNRIPMELFMHTAQPPLNMAEACGAFRLWISLKPGCRRVQLPVAVKQLEDCVRLPQLVNARPLIAAAPVILKGLVAVCLGLGPGYGG